MAWFCPRRRRSGRASPRLSLRLPHARQIRRVGSARHVQSCGRDVRRRTCHTLPRRRRVRRGHRRADFAHRSCTIVRRLVVQAAWQTCSLPGQGRRRGMGRARGVRRPARLRDARRSLPHALHDVEPESSTSWRCDVARPFEMDEARPCLFRTFPRSRNEVRVSGLRT